MSLVSPEAVVSGSQPFVDIDFEGSLVVGMFYLHDLDRHPLHLLDGFRQEPFFPGGGFECPGQLQAEPAFIPMVSDSEFILGEDTGEGCGISWLARCRHGPVSTYPLYQAIGSPHIQGVIIPIEDIHAFSGGTTLSDLFPPSCGELAGVFQFQQWTTLEPVEERLKSRHLFLKSYDMPLQSGSSRRPWAEGCSTVNFDVSFFVARVLVKGAEKLGHWGVAVQGKCPPNCSA